MRKNGLLTFATACVPGCGQMYLGYMRRGLSLAFWFWGLVFLATFLKLGVLAFLLPVIWAFAFFDAFNIRNLAPEQRAVFPDEFIPNQAFLHQYKLDRIIKSQNTGKIIAWGLIIIGILILFNNVYYRVYWGLVQYFPFLAGFLDSLVPLAIALAVIILGVRMLRANKNQPPPNPPPTPYDGDGQP